MALDYFKIKSENELRYGTDIGRIGPMLLANRYDDRTHFIFELLQNAEDAFARRPDWEGSRAVKFSLSGGVLRVSHSGKAFDDRDVRGICGIAESTKDLTEIGRFGIGFKSVYAFTDRPEVHSGNEDFAIESFVWPTAITALGYQADETVFVLPLRKSDEGARTEIAEGLRRLGSRTLLFLRHIDEIDWSVDGGPSGLYVRGKPEEIDEDVYRIILLGEEQGKPEVEETWLLFSRVAKTLDGVIAGRVEIAFSIAHEKKSDRWLIGAVSDSPLVVFFPTMLPTHLGFLVQGPYRTTSITTKTAQRANLTNIFSQLFPIIRLYVAERCFGKSVDLDSEQVRTHLHRLELQEGIAKYLARKIGELTAERQVFEFEKADFKLSGTKPFSWRRNLPPLVAKRTVFNYVATYNPLERRFAEFLDKAADVVRFASLGTTEQGDSGTQFRVDYLKPSGAIGFYHPDWVVVQKAANDEVNWIIETKGRVWEGTEAKDDAIRYWCEQVSKSTGKPWRYARVNQPIFDTQKPKTLQEAAGGKGVSPLVLL